MDILSNLNIEVLEYYKDIFDFYYFKKNIGGFIILTLISFQIICIVYYYLYTKNKMIRYIYLLTEKYISEQKITKINSKTKIINNKNKKNIKIKSLKNPTIKSNKKEDKKNMKNHKKLNV